MSNKPIYFDEVFEKHYQKRVLKDKRLHELYKKAVALFIENPQHTDLHIHELKGRMSNKKAFSVAEDCRVIFIEDPDKFLLLDIGTHKEVYS